MEPLITVIFALGTVLSGAVAVAWWRWDRKRLLKQQEVERHDWNNRAMSLLLDVASLQMKLSKVPGDPALSELAESIRDGGQTLVRGTSRLDKILSRQVDELHCSSKCPGCRKVGTTAVVLLTNLTANAHEAKVRAHRGKVVARCDHSVLTIVNPLPAESPPRTGGLGLAQVDTLSESLGWRVESRRRPGEQAWEAKVEMS